MAESRTTWVEKQTALFLASPLTAETVFLRPTYRDGRVDKEVCDVLLGLRGDGVLLSLKSQEDPKARTGIRLSAWCGKHAAKAAGQLGGALRTIGSQPFWCQHPRRGCVRFEAGAIRPRHAVALVEVMDAVVELPEDLPGDRHDVPIAYFSLNDALNLIEQLRAFPDLVAYLDARLTLPPSVQRVVGRESLLYQCYLLNGESFGQYNTLSEIEIDMAYRSAEFRARLPKKRLRDSFARVVEGISDALATRMTDFSVGLDQRTLAAFDVDAERKNYLRLQEELCDLRLGARRALGFALFDARCHLEESEGRLPGTYRSFQVAEKPDLVYVLFASRGIPRPQLLTGMRGILFAARAHYGCRRAMGIADRDGVGFEICLIETDAVSEAERAAGAELFGSLASMTIRTSALPL
jgi:hypothetical protein